MIKLCLRPGAERVQPNNGIGRVVHAQLRDLPKRGFELVDEPDADLYVGHTQQFNMPRIDVMICHGIYWTGDVDSGNYGTYNHNANALIIDAARKARVVTTPSEWVAMPFKRDMRISPIVIGHGIDTAEWQIGKPQGYALWNKNRSLDVCNPIAAHELAKRGVEVMTTFGAKGQQRPKTMQIVGVQDSDAMKQLVSGASVYLATVKETWGIGTVEAMACGVPVLGWNYGGTSEIVTNGVEGILVKPGDYDALYEGYKKIMANREAMSRAARETAMRYDWQTAMDQYADLFTQVYERLQDEPRGVSFVITAYNYGRYISQAVDSVLKQTRKADEIIVVDDGSKDDTLDQLAKYIGSIKVIHQQNQGVAAARTVGIEATTQPHIVCLDADDWLEPRFTEVLHDAMLKDRGLGIAYTGLIGFNDEGGRWETDFPPQFTWDKQAQNTNPPANCIPSACMFRRDMWLRAGPHKQEYAPGEDAEFWTRGLSVGFTAEKVTNDRLFHYRMHTGSASREKKYKSIDDRLPWLRDHRFPMGAPLNDKAPEVRSYSEPVISIVIAVQSGQAALLANAIDSVLGQTVREWELIVVDDTYDHQDKTTQIDPLVIRRYPFVNWTIGEHKTLADARNMGLAEARAPLVLMVDPKDELMPDALYQMLVGYVESEGRFVYSDTYILTRWHDRERIRFGQWPALVTSGARRARVSALIPTDWLIKIGGWDEFEKDDNDLFVRLARKGYCGHHIDRVGLAQTHLNGYRSGKTVQTIGESDMGGCCGGNAAAVLAAKMAVQHMPGDVNTYAGDPVAGSVRMEYTASNVGSYTYNGHAGRTYRGGNNDTDRFAIVHPNDVEILERTSFWKVSPAPKPIEPQKPIEATPAIAPEPMLEAIAIVEPEQIKYEPEPMLETGAIVDDAVANGYKVLSKEMKQPTKAKRGKK